MRIIKYLKYSNFMMRGIKDRMRIFFAGVIWRFWLYLEGLIAEMFLLSFWKFFESRLPYLNLKIIVKRMMDISEKYKGGQFGLLKNIVRKLR